MLICAGVTSCRLQTVPTVLRDMAVNLVTHRLYLRRPEGQLPEAIKEVYRGSLKMLEALRDGKLTLGIARKWSGAPRAGGFSCPRPSGAL
ncbi:phage protein Gp36 family protein [Arsenophonus sp. PmNCSU2021_1]|uniref:phage protein Gp36 family protein n=1 Tax=Arsenophonus sp. PmNCSU2021_1 TaxID=3118989 RepID=UPI002FF1E7D1